MERDRTKGFSDRTIGFALVAASAVLWSTAGFFVRLAHVDAWTAIGWRSLASALFLGLFFAARNRKGFGGILPHLGWSGLFQIVTGAGATVAYVFALELTTVANVMMIYATLPFITAAIAFFWAGERIDGRLVIASGVALGGVVVMAGANTGARDLAGNALALAMTIGFGLQLVHVKRHPTADMPLLMGIAAALCALLSWPLMAPGLPDPLQIGALTAFGVLTTGLGYVLALEGSRRIGSGEAGVVTMLDVVLGPLWVWLAFAEVPGQSVAAGGALVLGAVLWYLWHGLRRPAAQMS